jgi:hypothetical protein
LGTCADAQEDGILPEGMTELRAALHGEQRYDYCRDGEGLDAAAMRHVHASSKASADWSRPRPTSPRRFN